MIKHVMECINCGYIHAPKKSDAKPITDEKCYYCDSLMIEIDQFDSSAFMFSVTSPYKRLETLKPEFQAKFYERSA